ncbi:MAG: glycosyltransferase [Deltaproteobacteria bacterium]|nr:glycosyltransferase [Deltaproteobacteria bacterium]
MPELSYVIINYNDAGRLPRAVASAALTAQAAGYSYEIWVVDNASLDHTPQVLAALEEALGPRLRVIRLEHNLGTTRSRNLALARSSGRLVCVMDSDAELLDAGQRRVDELLTRFPEVGIVGPRILLPDGHTYDSAKLLPTLTDKLLKVPGILLRTPTVNRDWYPDFPFPTTRPVHTAISCCWFFRRELFDLVGPLDEDIFYAPEDVDWCLRSWRAGRAVVWYPHLRVLHHTRQTSHKNPFSRTARSHLAGLFHYWNKHNYCLSRRETARRYIDPLAARLAPALAAW